MSDRLEKMRVRDEWHHAINNYSRQKDSVEWREMSFMYEAKDAASEIERLPLLFRAERLGELPTIHQQCSLSAPESIPENYLACCLGVRCSTCPFLLALNNSNVKDDELDTIKAWTCITHIISKGGDPAKEGYILTQDDVMYWRNLYANMAASDPDDESAATGTKEGR